LKHELKKIFAFVPYLFNMCNILDIYHIYNYNGVGKMKQIRLFVPNKDKNNRLISKEKLFYARLQIECICNRYESGYTKIKGVGYWDDYSEDTDIFIINSDSKDLENDIIGLAKSLKKYLNQECVLIEIQELEVKFI